MDDDMTNPNPGPPLEPTPPEGALAADPAADPAATAATPPGEAPPPRPSWKTWVAVGVGAAVVGAAAVFGISAATSSGSSNAAATSQAGTATGQGQGQSGPTGPRSRFGGGGFGTIADINGSTLTIEHQDNTTTKVVTSSKTSVTTSAPGTVDDIEVGDTVTVIGTGTSPDITATSVMDDGKVSTTAGNQGGPGGFGNGRPPGGAEGGFQPRQGQNGQIPGGGQGDRQVPGGANGASFTRGVVASVGDGTFTVTGIDGTAVTVTTSATTPVSVTKSATVGDLKVGDQVVVRGKQSKGTITATNIREGGLGGGVGFRPGASGGQAPTNGGSQ